MSTPEQSPAPTRKTQIAQLPAVCRWVHYAPPNPTEDPVPLAALMTRVSWSADIPATPQNAAVTLEIHYPDGHMDIQTPPYSEKLTPGCWTWPPRV